MEAKYLALTTPKPKVKKPPSEKQIKALENARIKKMENVAIRKDIASKKKQEDKRRIKEEVMEVRNKNESIDKDEIKEPINPIPVETKPTNSNEFNSRNSQPSAPLHTQYDTYENSVHKRVPKNNVRTTLFANYV